MLASAFISAATYPESAARVVTADGLEAVACTVPASTSTRVMIRGCIETVAFASVVAFASTAPEPPVPPVVVPDVSVPAPTSTPTFASTPTLPLTPVPPTFTVPCVAELAVLSTLSAAAGSAKPRERTTPVAAAMVLRLMFIFLLDYLVMAYLGHISAVAERPSYIKTNHHEITYGRRRA